MCKHGQVLNECCLLLPMFYIDVYLQNRLRQKLVVGIYMSTVNVPEEEHKKADLRVLLCIVLPDVRLSVALREVIVKPM